MVCYVGFDDACAVIFGVLGPEENVALLFKEKSQDLILKMLQAKAKNIVADIQIYRGDAIRFLGTKRAAKLASSHR